MNRKILFAMLGIVALITVVLVYVLLLPNKGAIVDQISHDQTAAQPQGVESPTSTSQDASVKKGEYRDYTKEVIPSTKGTKLLFFYAPWCPQCREIEAGIKADGVPDGVTVFKIDYDSNQKLRQQYGVTIQTTFVLIDDSGNKIASYVAYQEPRFSAVVRELLQ